MPFFSAVPGSVPPAVDPLAHRFAPSWVAACQWVAAISAVTAATLHVSELPNYLGQSLRLGVVFVVYAAAVVLGALAVMHRASWLRFTVLGVIALAGVPAFLAAGQVMPLTSASELLAAAWFEPTALFSMVARAIAVFAEAVAAAACLTGVLLMQPDGLSLARSAPRDGQPLVTAAESAR